ncbi:hypothetical protein GCM10007877_38000 [Marinibactrum halimedae]|uniref:Uncharacterized protein n=1 Tax=Marinibactrum halimedae TaxID=1444977 RepID=A0AA37T9D3_9GAMM|nr:hypothetical protein GCM10007877_38000 [Marinibactrum halimedae]
MICHQIGSRLFHGKVKPTYNDFLLVVFNLTFFERQTDERQVLKDRF